MFTQCPHCQTLFHISADQLKAAAGKAHCCRCDQVFSALENLQEPPASGRQPELPFIDHPPEPLNRERSLDPPDFDATLQETQKGLTDLLRALQITPDSAAPGAPEPQAIDDERDPFEPRYDLTDTDIDSVQIGLDSQLYGALDPSEIDHIPDPHPTGGAVNTEIAPHLTPPFPEGAVAIAPFEIPDDLPEIPPTEAGPLSLETSLTATTTDKTGTFGWSITIICLLLLALGQLSWFGRDHLLQYPAGRQLLALICNPLPCQLPPQHNPDKIQVISRDISTHPEHDKALLVTLTLRNEAKFAQPYPLIELSLLDRKEHLVARRRFTPQEYHGSGNSQLQPGIPTTLKLELQDPGEEVVGFRFDFY